MDMPVRILPLAIKAILDRDLSCGSRNPTPTNKACTKDSPSAKGVPTEFENSGGAAPVPPSPPYVEGSHGRRKEKNI